MNAKTDHMRESRRHKAGTLIRNLKKRGIEGTYFDTAGEAVKAVCSGIAPRSLVGLGGSESIIESGLLDALRAMDIRLLDRYREGIGKAEVDAMRLEGLRSDIFIMSSNAVTADGRLVNIDGTGNRVAALVFGPKRVIVIAGMNKVAPDLESAVARARNTAAAANSLRVGVDTPCSHTGFCQDPHCHPPRRICCQLVVTEGAMAPGRIQVVLVGEDLGY